MKFLPSINYSDIYRHNILLLCPLVYIDKKKLSMYIKGIAVGNYRMKKKMTCDYYK